MERMIRQAPIQPSAGTITDLYAVPSGFESIIASIIVCNIDDTNSATFKIRKALDGAANAASQAGWDDAELGPNETMVISPAYTLGGADKIRCSSSTGTVTFDANGTEVN